MGDCSKIAKAVFLDRDGVINRAIVRDGLPFPPPTIDDFDILPNVLESLLMLKENGFLLIVVTNQPDVGRGIQKKETVERMHDYLLQNLPLNEIYVCWHEKDGTCNCRKPLPGLLFQAAKDLNINLKNSFIIGDRWKDIDAGFAAGCKSIFIDYAYNETINYKPDYTTTSILDASEWILHQTLFQYSSNPN